MCARYTVGGGNTPKEWAMKRKEEEEEHDDLSHDPRSKDGGVLRWRSERLCFQQAPIYIV